jgi:hypothetical protein
MMETTKRKKIKIKMGPLEFVLSLLIGCMKIMILKLWVT